MFNINSCLPFNTVNNNEFIELMSDRENYLNLSYLNRLSYDQFSTTLNRYGDDFDPDINHFNMLKEKIENCLYYFSDNFKPNPKCKTFSVCSFNINSIPHNFESFVDQCYNGLNHQFDILGLCETKLNDEINELYNLEGYNKYSYNVSRNCGGIAVFVRKDYEHVKVRYDLSKNCHHIESLFVELEIPETNSKIICGEIYRRPNSNILSFINDLEDIVDIINTEGKKLYLMGDFNINLFDFSSNNNVRNFIDVMHSKNLYCLINKSTRVTSTSRTLIDHIWSNDYKNCDFNGIIFEKISDHFPVFSFFNLNNSSNNSNKHNSSNNSNSFITTSFRDFSSEKISIFKAALQNVDWSLVSISNNVNVAYANFITIFNAMFERYFPLIEKKVRIDHSNKPWITPELKSKIQEKID